MGSTPAAEANSFTIDSMVSTLRKAPRPRSDDVRRGRSCTRLLTIRNPGRGHRDRQEVLPQGCRTPVHVPVSRHPWRRQAVVPVENAQKLYDVVGSKNKTIKIFTAAEGGAQHAHVDNREVGIDFAADWLEDNM